ncbi:uncharacterized protein NFIA_112830 [Aspergillus fischeri NRRL 181]|uniref:Integral membrane protein n=1 Tax=Neosartorya fischeri (strain ATCC 1020 / DSM 3700 / CBS 544.65 / FGSC A1164 / JCM 1740 / NRRL 181 / WB 181) TaxID=331117 RepID=A1D8P7_NEOFI|nr:uncharacterized protein NFIA_112830 [Aspergillus fischeri NRRL 181]EAW20758.1 hypothetical protein NFIA_112830 [Aspergillus fischeri NRRL 181]
MAHVEGLQATLGYLENPTALTVTSVGMCLCWLVSYAAMIRKSFQDRSYCMPLMPLCCDLAHEFVFSVICPPTEDPILQYFFASWLAGSVMMSPNLDQMMHQHGLVVSANYSLVLVPCAN